jgi:hypothetical protein
MKVSTMMRCTRSGTKSLLLGSARQMNVVIVQTERFEGRCGVRYVGRPVRVRRSAAPTHSLSSLSLFISFERP